MTPREKAQELLAEALHATTCPKHIGSPLRHTAEFGEGYWPCRQDAAAILLAHPALAAALELGVAWQMAEAALPEGWAINLVWGTITTERWGVNAGPFPAKPGYVGRTAGGATPAEAIAALAAALEAGRA